MRLARIMDGQEWPEPNWWPGRAVAEKGAGTMECGFSLGFGAGSSLGRRFRCQMGSMEI